MDKIEKIKMLWAELLEQGPTNGDLCYIIEWVEPLREEAGRKLLEQEPSNNDLRYIIKWVEPLREEAKKLLRLSREEIMREIKLLY